MTHASLLPLPAAIRTLSNEESRHLEARYPDLPRDPEHCPTCHGKKTFDWYDVQSDGSRSSAVITYDCPCEEQWILNRYLLHCGIGIAYQRLSWDDCVIKRPPEMIDWLIHADAYIPAGFGFVLSGDMGNGKTMLALLGLKGLIAQGVDGYFTTFTEMVDTYTSTWRDKEDRKWFTRRVRNAGVLVIDDLGRENKRTRTRNRAEVEAGVEDAEVETSHTFMTTAFEEIVRHRVAQAKPTIITTNLAWDRLSQRYSTNVFSLLQERSDVIHFTGADFRGQANQRLKAEARSGLTRPVVLS